MLQTSFRKVMVAAVLSLPIVSLNLHAALADDMRDFTVINKTQTGMQHLYVSHASQDEWGKDILGIKFLGKGKSLLIYFTDKSKVCVYDIKAVFEDGETVEDYKINLCETRSYTFTGR